MAVGLGGQDAERARVEGYLSQRNEAAVVQVGSGLALAPKSSAPTYCASKAALHSFTQALRYQLAASDVRVVEIFPDVPSLIRLVGTLLAEMDDEWQVGRRYFSQESMRKLDEPELDLLAEPTPLRLAPVR